MRTAIAIALVLVVGLAAGCDDDDGGASTICREAPELCDDGEPGAFCDFDSECSGFCCTDDDNCGGGMCTFDCSRDADCPFLMGCEHGMCFYLCDSSGECAPGQSCEHDRTVCEY